MRRRLTIAIVLLVAATLVVTSVGSYVLIRHAAISSGQQELAGQARAISATLSDTTYRTKAAFRREQKVITETGAFDSLDLVALYPNGSVTGPAPAAGHHRRPAGRSPTFGTAARQTGTPRHCWPTPPFPPRSSTVTSYLPVLVVTRQIQNPANGFRYFLLVGAIGLAIAAVVAAALARRFTRPLVAAVNATRRIASGDLDATVPRCGPRGPRVRPAGRFDQRHGCQPGPRPGPGTSVPPLRLP